MPAKPGRSRTRQGVTGRDRVRNYLVSALAVGPIPPIRLRPRTILPAFVLRSEFPGDAHMTDIADVDMLSVGRYPYRL